VEKRKGEGRVERRAKGRGGKDWRGESRVGQDITRQANRDT
jgi:hypothetical protein